MPIRSSAKGAVPGAGDRRRVRIGIPVVMYFRIVCREMFDGIERFPPTVATLGRCVGVPAVGLSYCGAKRLLGRNDHAKVEEPL